MALRSSLLTGRTLGSAIASSPSSTRVFLRTFSDEIRSEEGRLSGVRTTRPQTWRRFSCISSIVTEPRVSSKDGKKFVIIKVPINGPGPTVFADVIIRASEQNTIETHLAKGTRIFVEGVPTIGARFDNKNNPTPTLAIFTDPSNVKILNPPKKREAEPESEPTNDNQSSA